MIDGELEVKNIAITFYYYHKKSVTATYLLVIRAKTVMVMHEFINIFSLSVYRMESYLQIEYQDPPLPKVRDADHQGRERVCLCDKALR